MTSTLNIENINKVADAIEHEEIKGLVFNMGVFAEEQSCGTAACIARWAVALKGLDPLKVSRSYWSDKRKTDVPDVAQKFLGLSGDEATELFHANDFWGNLSGITRPHAVAVLRHLAKTGEVDWTIGAPSKTEAA